MCGVCLVSQLFPTYFMYYQFDLGSAFPSQPGEKWLWGDGTPTEQIFSLSAGLVLEEFELTTNWVGPALEVLLIKPVGWNTVEVSFFFAASTAVVNQQRLFHWQEIVFNGFTDRWSHSKRVQDVNGNKSHRNLTIRSMYDDYHRANTWIFRRAICWNQRNCVLVWKIKQPWKNEAIL